MTRTVLITGAGSGMGMATALLLAGAGYHVFAGVRDNGAEPMARTQERGLQITTVQMDVRTPLRSAAPSRR